MSALSQSLLFKPSTNNASTGTVAVVYPNTATETLVYNSAPVRGAGYFSSNHGMHTVMYVTASDFIGTVTMQATLATAPSDNDWFTVVDTGVSYSEFSVRTTSSVDLKNFEGNFVWVRGAVLIDQGSVLMVQYNQ